MTSDKVVEIIYHNTDAHLNMRPIRDTVHSFGKYWVLSDFPVSNLKGLDRVNPGMAIPDKGPIVIKPDGEIIDGRHRAALAIQQGKLTIQAYKPYMRM